MFFHNNFIDIILFVAVAGIICLWFYQNNISAITTHTNTKQNSFLSADKEVLTKSAMPGGVIVNDIEFPQEHNKTRLLTNQRGVNVGFHEQFKKWLPELGWRSFYLRNFNGLNDLEDGGANKEKTAVNNYLSCLTNTDNVYKYVNY
jgi:hypothetical protein